MTPNYQALFPSSKVSSGYEYVGREHLLDEVTILTHRFKKDALSRELTLIGVKGVASKRFMNQLMFEAKKEQLFFIEIKAKKDSSLPLLLMPSLIAVLFELRYQYAVGFGSPTILKEKIIDALAAVAGLIQTYCKKDVEMGFSFGLESKVGIADTGDLALDMQEVFLASGQIVKELGTAFIVMIDDLDSISGIELNILIDAMYASAQIPIPVILVGRLPDAFEPQS